MLLIGSNLAGLAGALTPLYVVLLDEYQRWIGDRRLVHELEQEARPALNWIDEYADPRTSALARVPSVQTREPRSAGTVPV